MSPLKNKKHNRLKSFKSIEPKFKDADLLDKRYDSVKLAGALEKKKELSLKELILLKSSKFSNTAIQPQTLPIKADAFFPERLPVGSRKRIHPDGLSPKFMPGSNDTLGNS